MCTKRYRNSWGAQGFTGIIGARKGKLEPRNFGSPHRPGGWYSGGGNKSENAGITSVDRSTKATLTLTVPGSK